MTPLEDTIALRSAFGRFATGVTVVTARAAAGELIGITVNSFSSVSLDPPLVLFSIDKRCASLPGLRAAPGLAVNVLGRDQEDISGRFARAFTDKWTGILHRPGLAGAPLLDGAVACFECSPWAVYEGGDHLIFVCRVERFDCDIEKPPLLFYGGRYADLIEAATPIRTAG
jgi:flavin reductase (DIM6/NTAB) family NADH-FMN oxidoreductase RutF